MLESTSTPQPPETSGKVDTHTIFNRIKDKIKQAWVVNKEKRSGEVVQKTAQQILADLAQIWDLENPESNVSVVIDDPSYYLENNLLELQPTEQRYRRGQDVYVHEIVHALIFTNNQKHRNLSQEILMLDKKITEYRKDFELHWWGKLNTEFLPSMKKLIDLRQIRILYEEMIASLAGHHLHRIPNIQELQNQKQKTIKYINRMKDITQKYLKDMQPFLEMRKLNRTKSRALLEKTDDYSDSLYKYIHEIGQSLGSIIAASYPDLSVKQLIHMDPSIMEELLEVENEEQLKLFLKNFNTKPERE